MQQNISISFQQGQRIGNNHIIFFKRIKEIFEEKNHDLLLQLYNIHKPIINPQELELGQEEQDLNNKFLLDCLLFTEEDTFIQAQAASLFNNNVVSQDWIKILYGKWVNAFNGDIKDKLRLVGKYKLIKCQSKQRRRMEEQFDLKKLIIELFLEGDSKQLEKLQLYFQQHLINQFPHMVVTIIELGHFDEKIENFKLFLPSISNSIFDDQKVLQDVENVDNKLYDSEEEILQVVNHLLDKLDFNRNSLLSDQLFLGIPSNYIPKHLLFKQTDYYLMAFNIYQQIHGLSNSSQQILMWAKIEGIEDNIITNELITLQLYFAKTQIARSDYISYENFKKIVNQLGNVLVDYPRNLLPNLICEELYKGFQNVSSINNYRQQLLSIFQEHKQYSEEFIVHLFEIICSNFNNSESVVVEQEQKEEKWDVDIYENEDENKTERLLSFEIFMELKKIVQKITLECLQRSMIDSFANIIYLQIDWLKHVIFIEILQRFQNNRINKDLQLSQMTLGLSYLRFATYVKFQTTSTLIILQRFQLQNIIYKDLFTRYFGQSNNVRFQASLQSIGLILENQIIGRRKSSLLAMCEYTPHQLKKNQELLNLDDIHDLKKLLRNTFVKYFNNVESCDIKVQSLIMEKYIDFNKFKEIRTFIREKKIQLNPEEYDSIFSKVIEKCLRQSKNMEQMDEFIKKVFDIFADIKKTLQKQNIDIKKTFKLISRKRNILKIINILRIWNLEYESLNFVNILELQDTSQCNTIVKGFFKHIQHDNKLLLEIPFVKIKRKLVKSAQFSKSYEVPKDQLQKLIFDIEFCNFLIQLAQIYMKHNHLERTQILIELLYDNVTDGDILANISIQMINNPVLISKNVKDLTKQQSIKKGVIMAKSPQTICSLISFMKNIKQSDPTTSAEAIVESQSQGVKSKLLHISSSIVKETKSSYSQLQLNLTNDFYESFSKKKIKLVNTELLISFPNTKKDKQKFKEEYLRQSLMILQQAPQQIQDFNEKDNEFLILFFDILNVDYSQAFTLLKYQEKLTNYEYVIRKLAGSRLFDNSKLLTCYLKCLLTKFGRTKFNLIKEIFPDLTLEKFTSGQFFTRFPLMELQKQIKNYKSEFNQQIEKLFQSITLCQKMQFIPLEHNEVEGFLFDKTFRNSKLAQLLSVKIINLIDQEPENIKIVQQIPLLKEFTDFNLLEILIISSIQQVRKLDLANYFIDNDKQTRVQLTQGEKKVLQQQEQWDDLDLDLDVSLVREYFREIKSLSKESISQQQLIQKYYGRVQDCRLLMIVQEFINDPLPLNDKQYILLRSFIKCNVATMVSTPENINQQESWNYIFRWLSCHLGLSEDNRNKSEPFEPELHMNISRICDHDNIFILLEVLPQFNAELRSKINLIYFEKLCQRVLNSPAQQEVDIPIMKQWITKCKNKEQVEELKSYLIKFINQNSDKNLQNLLELIP